ncbi:beta-fructosidase [Neokomagataea thailandica NBRC 106555]|nr:beta-fructosidase [Neokomagataea thailandica NBRC 106555]
MTLEEKASQLVNQARAIPRLNVPAYDWWNEGLHGVALPGATQFPEPIGLAATFDTNAIRDVATIVSTEMRILNKQANSRKNGASGLFEGRNLFAPNVNIDRDPRWGRGQETYGEDPTLTSSMGVAYIEGLQGTDPHYYRTAAVAKHLAVHSGPEATRRWVDIKASKHDMLDTYLPAFRAAAIDGKAAGLMCAYSSLNGEPDCASQYLLQDQMRGNWHYNGLMVADCDAVTGIYVAHNFTPDQKSATALAVKRGVDSECINYYGKVDGDGDYRPYVDAVRAGYLSEEAIDKAVKRLMVVRIRTGAFDPESLDPYSKIDPKELDSVKHRQFARDVAASSLVLLKNNGILPLSPTRKLKISVVGPLADQTRYMMGNYNGRPSHAVSVLEGLKKAFPQADISYEPGTQFLRNDAVPVPLQFLTHDGKPGLLAHYYVHHNVGDDEVGQTPLTDRMEPTVSLSPATLPKETTGKIDLSVNWDGTLTAPESGFYRLGLEGDGVLQVVVDGQQVAYDDWQGNGMERRLGKIRLEKGEKYKLHVHYAPLAHSIPSAHLIWTRFDDSKTDPKAIANARAADVVIAVVGLTSELEGEQMNIDEPGFHGGDRTSLDLPAPEENLLKDVASTGKPLVVVLANGGAMSVNWANEHAGAIIESWYAGEEGGTAVANTLSGANNPSGRLPITFYKSVDDLPPFGNYFMNNRTYRYYTGTPLFPFGYGLSYTHFEYSNLTLPAAPLTAGESLNVTAKVTNTGKLPGAEVVQLYLSFPKIDGAPLRALRGFKRVWLKPGQSEVVRFSLDARQQSMVTAAGQIIVPNGTYSLSIGGGQPNTTAPVTIGNYEVKGNAQIPE